MYSLEISSKGQNNYTHLKVIYWELLSKAILMIDYGFCWRKKITLGVIKRSVNLFKFFGSSYQGLRWNYLLETSPVGCGQKYWTLCLFLRAVRKDVFRVNEYFRLNIPVWGGIDMDFSNSQEVVDSKRD